MSTSTYRPAIAVAGLRKSYGDKLVLDGIDLTVPPGTIFALLGPNGAGKTTTVHILSTLIRPDGGDIRVAGHDVARDPDAVRDAIGVTGQFSAVDGLLTGQENLALMADLRHLDRAEGRRRIAELLEHFDLVDVAKKPAMTYSGGMQRRLDLAMTLVGRPRVLFLDEPTAGLDPRSRRSMWEIIRDLVASGATVFLTTQYLEEADQLADRIALLDHGRMIAEGTAEELKRLVPGGHVVLRFTDVGGLERAARLFDASARDNDALTLQVPSDGAVRSLRALLDRLDSASAEVEELSVHTPDLDDVFLARTGQPDAGHVDKQKETVAYAARDTRTMLRRNLRRMQRYPMMMLTLIGIPVIFLLLFVYVFGGALGAGLGEISGGRAAYVNYVVPGILLMSIASGATGTATSVAMDMTEGIIARFKTMAIFRPSVLTGHVLGSVIQTVMSLAVIIGVALLVGFRPNANPLEWLAAAGILVAISFAVTWLSVAFGLASKTIEGASNLPMPLILLPFLGSGFVLLTSSQFKQDDTPESCH